jgi:hypothetical protein
VGRSPRNQAATRQLAGQNRKTEPSASELVDNAHPSGKSQTSFATNPQMSTSPP